MRFFDEEMRVWVGAGEDAKAENICYDQRRFARAIDAVIRKLVRGNALGMQGAKAGLVTEERAAGHGHATRKQSFDWRIEPDDRNALRSQKVRRACLGVGATAEGEYAGFAQFECTAERGAELRGFEQAEGRFTVAFEKFPYAQAGSVLDAVVEINEAPGELAGQLGAYGRLAGTHESGEGDH